MQTAIIQSSSKYASDVLRRSQDDLLDSWQVSHGKTQPPAPITTVSCNSSCALAFLASSAAISPFCATDWLQKASEIVNQPTSAVHT